MTTIISLNAHPCFILSLDTPVKEFTNKSGRPVLVFDGEIIQQHILLLVEASGMPVPHVSRLGPSIEELEVGSISIPCQVASGVTISNLPPQEEGIVYLTSFPTAQAAKELGRTDFITSGQLVFAQYDEEKGAGVGIVGCLGVNRL